MSIEKRKERSSWRRIAWRLVLVMFACGLVTNCALCERGASGVDAANSSEAFAKKIPASAELAVFVGDWKSLRDSITATERQLGGEFPIEAGLAEIKRMLGIDPRDIEALRLKGIKTEAGAAVVQIDGQWLIYIPTEKSSVFEALVMGLGQKRFNAVEKVVTKEIGGKMVSFLLDKSAKPEAGQQNPMLTASNVVISWTIIDGVVVLYPGKTLLGNSKDPEIVLGSVLRLTAETSMFALPSFETLRSALGSRYPIFGLYDVVGVLKKESAASKDPVEVEALQKMSTQFLHAGVGLQVTDQKVDVEALALATPEAAKRFKASSLAQSEFGLEGALSDKNALLIKLAMDPVVFFNQMRADMREDERKLFDATLAELKAQRKVDVAGELLPTLDGNLVVTLNGVDRNGIAKAFLMGSQDVLSIMGALDLTVSFGVKDAKALNNVLGGVQEAASGFISKEDSDGLTLYRVKPLGGGAQAKPLLSAAVGAKQLVLWPGKVDEKVGMTSAKLASSTRSVAASKPLGNSILSERSRSGLVVDVPLLSSMLSDVGGGQAAQLLSMLKPFSGWFLTGKATDKGIAANLELLFVAKPVKGGGDDSP